MYDKLFSATNGLIEIDKSKFYAWIWQWRQGQKVIKQRNIKLDMKSQQLEQNDVNDSIRSLGVHIGPSLEWDTQFKVMKEKMLEAVTKIELMETCHPHPMSSSTCVCAERHVLDAESHQLMASKKKNL